MKLRKKGFSFISFFISAIILSVITVMLISDTITNLKIAEFTFSNSFLNIIYKPALAILVLVISIAVLFFIRFIRTKIIKKYAPNSIFRRILHYLLLLTILCAGIYFRYKNVEFNSKNDSVSEYVKKLFNHQPTGIHDTLTYFYVWIIAFVSKFVGLKESVFLWVNLVFDTISALFVYGSFRKLFGRLPALGSFAGVMVLSSSYFTVTSNQGYSLLFLLSSFSMFLFSLLIIARYKRVSDSNGHIVWFILLGLLTGFVAYLHLYALIIWIFMFSLIFIYRPEKADSFTDETPEEQLEKYGEVIEYPDFIYDDDYEEEAVWHGNVWPVSLFLVFSAIAFVGMLLVDSFVYNLDFSNILFENGYLNILSFDTLNKFAPNSYLMELSVILIICCFGVLSFLLHSTDNLSGLGIGLLLVLFVFCFLKDTSTAYVLWFIFLGAFFGNGIDFLLFRKPRFSVANKEAIITEENKGTLTFDNISLSEEINSNKEKEIKFIENVLPVPKKHIKKELDYAFEPSEEKMKYDVEVKDDDDFDVL